ncbi:hypothetical protein QVD17_01743 [Tagetes erecta]|uniref:NAC-A/B domain-containing protein n=1 Tax=Tagetes erecta TaxID=13708 RepID=A0AAD8LE68_TARER|nr:hypothetical protein QVD17_01743 [Tagetes erecta]
MLETFHSHLSLSKISFTFLSHNFLGSDSQQFQPLFISHLLYSWFPSLTVNEYFRSVKNPTFFLFICWIFATPSLTEDSKDLGYIPSFTNYFKISVVVGVLKDVKEEDENYNDDADSDNDEDDKDDAAQGLLVTTNQNILRSCIVATSEMHYEIFRIDKRPSYMGSDQCFLLWWVTQMGKRLLSSKQSRSEKKSRKAMLKLGMKPVLGVSNVIIKKG